MPVKEPSSYELLVLSGLQNKPVYPGTVDPVVVQERRRRNRAARKQRRVNRRKSR